MRRRYALPWPPDADPPAEPAPKPPARLGGLWRGACWRCNGSGAVSLAELGGDDSGDRVGCPVCGGSGIGEPRDALSYE